MPATNPILIHVGRGDIFINVPPPAVIPVAAPPVVLNPDGSPTTGGRYIGSTLGPARMIWRPRTFDIRSQQATSIVGYVITEDELNLEFEVGEIAYENLRDTIMGMLDQGGAVSMGGIIFPRVLSCLVVAPRRAGGFMQGMIYQGVMGEDRTFEFNRAGQLSLRVVFRGQGITTRNLGDQLGYFWPGP